MTGEVFQFIERAGVLEHFRVKFDSSISGVATGATARGFLFILRVGCRISAQEKLGIAAGGRSNQRLLMGVALENWQAIVVRANTANQHMVAVVEQVVCGDSSRDICRSLAHEMSGIAGGD